MSTRRQCVYQTRRVQPKDRVPVLQIRTVGTHVVGETIVALMGPIALSFINREHKGIRTIPFLGDRMVSTLPLNRTPTRLLCRVIFLCVNIAGHKANI